MNLKDKTLCIIDTGLSTHYAVTMAKSYGHVVYHIPDSDSYKHDYRAKIGTGLEGVEVVDEDTLCEYIDEGPGGKIDLFFFPDLGFRGQQEHLRNLGFPVAGSGFSDIMETDKYKFYQTLKKLGLPVAPFELVKGVDNLRKNLEKQTQPVYVKLRDQRYRGITETFRCEDAEDVEPVLDDIACSVSDKEGVEFVVQQTIKSKCEIGIDTLCLDGEYPQNSLVGIEGKDSWYIGRIFYDFPKILQPFMDKMAPVFKKLGCAGMYSTEKRIEESGTVNGLDLTLRKPSPPGALLPELYEDGNFAEAINDLAHGKLPKLRPKAKCGIQLILTSEWYKGGHKIKVGFPNEIARWVKLKNYYEKDGIAWVLPNDNDGYLGSVVAIGDTLEETAKLINEYASKIRAYKLSFEDNVLDASSKSRDKAAVFGINL
jgi:hypothetical protein